MAQSPTILGNYQIEEMIAVGGMARTYRAMRIDSPDLPICVKLLHRELVENIEFIQMFIDEATIAQTLKHPNIVRVYELGRAGESHYIAMELVDGKDLKQLSERATQRGVRMTAGMVAVVIRDICRALDYVHNKCSDDGVSLGIIHRDVSPHNIMLTFNGGRVKLTDFGIAKAASRLTRTRTGAVKGKYGYMSPEQAQGRSIDARSDLFAVGIIMHELLTGKRLFNAESGFEAFAMVIEDPIPAPNSISSDIDAELSRICLRALERNLDQRYPSCHHMGDELSAWLAKHTKGREAVGLGSFLRTLFDLEQGELPKAKPIHAPEETALSKLQTQIIEPVYSGSFPSVPLEPDSPDATAVFVLGDELTAEKTEAHDTSALMRQFSASTHTDILNPLADLENPTDHGFAEQAFAEVLPMEIPIGDPTGPVDVPAALQSPPFHGDAHDPLYAPPTAVGPPPVEPPPNLPTPANSNEKVRPTVEINIPPPKPAETSFNRPTKQLKRMRAPSRSSAPVWIALTGIGLLACALLIGMFLLWRTYTNQPASPKIAQRDTPTLLEPSVGNGEDDDAPADNKDDDAAPIPDEDTQDKAIEPVADTALDNAQETEKEEDDTPPDPNTTPTETAEADDTLAANPGDPPTEVEDDTDASENGTAEVEKTTPSEEIPDLPSDPVVPSEDTVASDSGSERIPDPPDTEISMTQGFGNLPIGPAEPTLEVDEEEALRRKRIKARREMGTLIINAKPWANITVDGRARGRTPKKIRVKAGSYTILLQNPELKRAVRKNVTVGKSQNKTITHTFK